MHEEQRGQKRNRYRGGHDHGRARRTEEQTEHQHGEQDADQRRLAHVADRVDDQGRLVRDDTHLHPGQVSLEASQRIEHGLGHGDRVGPGFLVDRQPDTLASVDTHEVADLAIGPADVGHVGDTDRNASSARVFSIAHDDVTHVVRLAVAREPANHVDTAALFERAGVDVDVGVTQTPFDLDQRQTVGLELVTIDLDTQLAVATAGDPDLGHALEPFHRRGQLSARDLTHLGQVGTILVGQQSENDDRHLTRIEATNHDLVDVGVGSYRTDGFLHFDQGEVHLRVPLEAHGADDPSGARHLADLTDAAHGEQPLLEQFAIDPLHLGRGPIAGANGDHDRRALQVGKQIQRQVLPRSPA